LKKSIGEEEAGVKEKKAPEKLSDASVQGKGEGGFGGDGMK
jgi:hypothetical protein